MSKEAVARLDLTGIDLKRRPMEMPRGLRSFSNEMVSVEEEVTLDLMVPTECGQLLLRNVNCWVSPHSLPASLGDFLMSRHLMRKLGYDENELLTKACQRADERDMAAVADLVTSEEGQLEEVEDERLLPDLSMGRREEELKIRQLLRYKVGAIESGASTPWAEKLG